MCKAMNRSLSNVLFSGFASVSTTVTEVEGEIKPISVEDAYYVLEAATNVAIIPATVWRLHRRRRGEGAYGASRSQRL